MSRLKGWWKQVRVLVRKEAVERELDEELAFHIEMETAKNLRAGDSPAEARRRALLAFNGVERTREQVREARWTRIVEDVAVDVRHAVRSLRRRPLFTLVAVLTLGLGIGANSALFGLFHALAFRAPAGLSSTEGLLWIDNGGVVPDVSVPDFRDLREAVSEVADVAAFTSAGMGLTVEAVPYRVTGALVSGNYFEVLGVTPAAGRGFRPEEDRPGGPPVAVVGYDVWQERMGGAPEAVGSVVRVNGTAFTVVGVAPEGFAGLDVEARVGLWVPLSAQPYAMPRTWDVLGSREARTVRMVGRLGEGVSRERAGLAVAAAGRAIDALSPDAVPFTPAVAPLRGLVRLDRMRGLLPLLAAAGMLTGLVLLVACANVANLLLARAFARRHEIGIRLAIGAGRGRLIRFLLTEALVLSLGAAAAGVGLAWWGASVFQARFRGTLAPLDVSPDAGTLAFTVLLAIGTAALFGLAPAWRAARPGFGAILGARADGGRPRRAQRALVVAQLAVSLALLVCAGLLVRRLDGMRALDPGYDADRVLAVSFDLTARGLDDAETAGFYAALGEDVAALPGVAAVSGPSAAPLGGGGVFLSAGLAGEGTRTSAVGVGVADGYFATLGIGLVQGRAIDRRDLEAGAEVAVVSASFAERLWPGESAVGRTFEVRGVESPIEVIGVARDVSLTHLRADRLPQIYRPYPLHYRRSETTLLVRATDPARLIPAVREAVRRRAPDLPIVDARIVQASVQETLAYSRDLVAVVAALGGLAVLLAALGLYGVIAFTVAGRTREIGIRVALGAPADRIVREVIAEGMRLALAGLVLGTLLALAAARILAAAVEGVHGLAPGAGVGAIAVLVAVTLLGTWLPARRAARVDPLWALRTER